jgi:hypothetical protein
VYGDWGGGQRSFAVVVFQQVGGGCVTADDKGVGWAAVERFLCSG